MIHGLLTQTRTTFHGRYFQVTDAYCEPKSVQEPHPPIVIGGAGERRTIPLAAKWADHWNAARPASVDEFSHKLRLLRRALRRDRPRPGRDHGVRLPVRPRARPRRPTGRRVRRGRCRHGDRAARALRGRRCSNRSPPPSNRSRAETALTPPHRHTRTWSATPPPAVTRTWSRARAHNPALAVRVPPANVSSRSPPSRGSSRSSGSAWGPAGPGTWSRWPPSRRGGRRAWSW